MKKNSHSKHDVVFYTASSCSTPLIDILRNPF